MKDKLGTIVIVVMTALALVAFALVAFGVIGGSAVTASERTLSINGTGIIYLSPELATINLGVTTEATDVASAIEKSNRVISDIRQVLADHGLAEADVQTTNFSVYPMNDYGMEIGEMQTTYRVDNSVNVVVRDLSVLGEILDQVVQAGANSIYGIQFGVADLESQYQAAVELAVQNANERAEDLAAAGDVSLGEIQVISSYYGGSGVPYFEAAMDRPQGGGGSDVPISPGELEVRVEVNVVYKLK